MTFGANPITRQQSVRLRYRCVAEPRECGCDIILSLLLSAARTAAAAALLLVLLAACCCLLALYRLYACTRIIINMMPVAPVAYQVILEPGIRQFRQFESPRVYTHINSLGLFLVPKMTCGKRESVSEQHSMTTRREVELLNPVRDKS